MTTDPTGIEPRDLPGPATLDTALRSQGVSIAPDLDEKLRAAGYVLVHRSTLVALSRAWGEMPYGGSVDAPGVPPVILDRRRVSGWEDPRNLVAKLRGLAATLRDVARRNIEVEHERDQIERDLDAVRRVFSAVPKANARVQVAEILAGASCAITEDTDPGILDQIVEALS